MHPEKVYKWVFKISNLVKYLKNQKRTKREEDNPQRLQARKCFPLPKFVKSLRVIHFLSKKNVKKRRVTRLQQPMQALQLSKRPTERSNAKRKNASTSSATVAKRRFMGIECQTSAHTHPILLYSPKSEIQTWCEPCLTLRPKMHKSRPQSQKPDNVTLFQSSQTVQKLGDS